MNESKANTMNWFWYAIGAALMAIAGIFHFREPATLHRVLGIILSIADLFLLRQ